MCELTIREAERAAVLALYALYALYAQPAIDDGVVLPVAEAERLFARMRRYLDYRRHVAVRDTWVVGTYALLVMDNLAHCRPGRSRMWRLARRRNAPGSAAR